MAGETKPIAAAKNVDEYLESLPEPMQIVLEKLRQAIKVAAPQAEELISYRVPTYKYMGPLVHFAAFKNHCSLVVINKELITVFGKELKDYKTSGTTIHFTPEKPLPATLVQKIVKARVKENKERHEMSESIGKSPKKPRGGKLTSKK